MKVLLTGAGGFVGAHVLRHIMMETDWTVVAPVTFRHKGLPERIQSSICTDPGWADRLDVVHWDLTAPPSAIVLRQLEGCRAILNVASESHVDRSIEDPVGFISNNVQLMLSVLEVARKIRPDVFLQMSTDEVYGPAYGDHRHREWEPVRPSNPYSASKAAQEAIAFSYWRTYDVPLVLTNTMNIIGEMQDPEKFLPMIIRNVLNDRYTTVHCSPEGEPGSRFYLHARNLADAWVWLVKEYTAPLGWPVPSFKDGHIQPERLNIVGEREIDNIELVHRVYDAVQLADPALLLGREPRVEKVSFHASRPGHDLRYALDGRKLEQLGWKAPVPFADSLRKTVAWTLEHPEWLELS